jgi:hypothetical protein
MADIVLRQRERDNYLIALYELSGGRSMAWPSQDQIAEASGVSKEDVIDVGQYLAGERLCELKTMGGLSGKVSITNYGVNQAEKLLLARTPRIGEAELRQHAEVIVRVLLEEVEKEPSLSADDRLNITSDLASIRDQLQAPNPNRSIIKAGLERIQRIWPAVVNITTVAASVIAILHGW